jgi:hypothetical protein
MFENVQFEFENNVTYIYYNFILKTTVVIHEGKATQAAGMAFIFLLVSPHTEIMGVTQHIFYRLHLG